MTLQEKIQKKAEGFGKLAPVFLEGAKFALENQWISVDDDLPYNHEELLSKDKEGYTELVLVYTNIGVIFIPMRKYNNGWRWTTSGYFPAVIITHWMPFPFISR